ncbi:DUF5996 family protein [Pararhizobium mangrovi]|uniref:Uncharacterized protein n=1 Tax=Pararhizobium mangrovi TaxID=2590452 RepID=A0A506TW16_9HYPH|nr:hypothetical protein FJU11_15450 [Pararhizobium mangrovi]
MFESLHSDHIFPGFLETSDISWRQIRRQFHGIGGKTARSVLPADGRPDASDYESGISQAALLSFLSSTYEAAADLGGWDRENLECGIGRPRVVRPVRGIENAGTAKPMPTEPVRREDGPSMEKTKPSGAVATKPPIRATALFSPAAVPTWSASTDAITLAVSGTMHSR